MPILIQELVITAVVDPEQTPSPPHDPRGAESRERLIESCVAETLKILRQQRER